MMVLIVSGLPWTFPPRSDISVDSHVWYLCGAVAFMWWAWTQLKVVVASWLGAWVALVMLFTGMAESPNGVSLLGHEALKALLIPVVHNVVWVGWVRTFTTVESLRGSCSCFL